MSEWQSIENPPDTDRDVLTCDAVSKKLLVGWHLDGDWFDTLRGDAFAATHWRDVALPGESPIKVCPSCKCAPHGGSCIQAGPLLTYAEQAGPESEDEAFERAFDAFNKTLSFTATPTEKIIFREGYTARARLDAERGK